MVYMDNDKDKPHKNNKMASFFQLTLMGEISKLENKVILFVLEIIFFFIIALLTGLAISYPIFKFGTLPETSGLYKVVVSLGLVILVMAMYIYRFIKSLMEERLRHAESDQRDKMLILHIIHSYHKLFPRWINVFSQTIYYISKRLLRGTFILIGFYLIATTGQLVSEKTLSLSSGGELSWYVPATLLFILLLLLG
ncbi:MAG: hypothetical protein OEZ36_11150, partial [Spirochaetota bacterium]|nr:hypothetical protein [Spirochaetota bacterium]